MGEGRSRAPDHTVHVLTVSQVGQRIVLGEYQRHRLNGERLHLRGRQAGYHVGSPPVLGHFQLSISFSRATRRLRSARKR